MKKWLLIFLGLCLVSLAGVHFFAPALIENNFNRHLNHPTFAVSENAQKLHNTLFVADLHSDSMLWKRNFLEESQRGHMDLPRLIKGNVALQIFAATTKVPSNMTYKGNSSDEDSLTMLTVGQLQPPATWFSLYQRAEWQLLKLTLFTDKSNGGLVLIRNSADLNQLVLGRQRGDRIVGGIFGIEGAHALEGDIENLERLYEKGLRVVGLSHFFDNEAGGSLHGLSGDGLSDFGKEVVKTANHLGIIIDVAHASPQMVSDILSISSKPVILSHGGVKGVCNKNRNLNDDLMLRLADAGGLLGIGYWDAAVCDISPRGIVRAIRAAIDLMGIDHVALGSDYDGATEVMIDTSELSILTHTMLENGFTEEEIRKVMGGNIQRFFIENLPQS